MKNYMKVSCTTLAFLLLTGCAQLQILALNQGELTEFHAEGDKLYIMGILNSRTFDQMREQLATHDQVKTIIFTAMPGSIDDETTFAMGRWLRDKGLNTHLLANSAIASGAVDLFLSGVIRTAETGAQIGVHSWSDGSTEAREIPKESPQHRLNADYIQTMLGSEEFYWYTIYSAPADAIKFMSAEDIAQHQLLTEPFSEPSGTKVPFKEYALKRQEILSD